MYGFTPEDIEVSGANHDDRPYASILYLSSAHERYDSRRGKAWQSILTLGVLGLETFGQLQREIHSLTSSSPAQGWGNQVSDGGELTLRYQFSRQSAVNIGRQGVQVKTHQQYSVGYLTEASVGLSLRAGKFNSSWWSFRPELSNYGEQRAGELGRRGERFFFAGMAIKARAYNAFLQGQFRHSEVSYSHGELNHVLLEAWAGYNHCLGDGYQFGYVLRGHSSEVKHGGGNRNVVWGGVVVSKTWI